MAIRSLIVRIGADTQAIDKALATVGESSKSLAAGLAKIGDTPFGKQAQIDAERLSKSLEAVRTAQERIASVARDAAVGIEQVGGVSNLTDRQLKEVNRTLQEGLSAYKALGREAPAELQKVADAVTHKLKPALSLNQIAGGLKTAGTAMTAALTVPLVGLGVLATKAARDFESSFAGVRKTVDGVVDEFGKLTPAGVRLQQGFRDLAREIPVSVNGLNRIGEAAGQLGIKQADILQFTKTMAILGTTTNLSSDQAANAVARIQNIFGAAGKDTDRFASSLVALGNAGASTESDIIEMGLRIAGAGKIAGLAQADILGIGNALSSVGVEAEAGGTAVQKVLLSMVQAVNSGGKQLDAFAAAAGQSSAQFAEAFRTNAAGAFTSFVEGLGKSGNKAIGILDELGLQDQRLIRSFLSLANAGDLLRTSIDLGSKSWQENTAATKEAAQRFQTFDSQMQLIQNRAQDVAITLGTALLPTFRDLLRIAEPFIQMLAEAAERFAALPAPIRSGAIVVGGLAAALGPAVFLIGTLAGSVSTLIPLLQGLTVAGTAAAGGMALLAGGAIVIGIGAAAIAVEQVVQAVKRLHETIRSGGSIWEFLSAKDDDNFVRRILGLSAATTDAAGAAKVAEGAYRSLKAQLSGAVQAKSLEDLNRLVLELSTAGELGTAQLRNIAQAAEAAAKSSGTKLSPALQNVVNAWHAMQVQQREPLGGGPKLDALADAIAKVKGELSSLTGAQKAQIKQAFDLGLSAADVAEKLGISADAVSAFKKQLDAKPVKVFDASVVALSAAMAKQRSEAEASLVAIGKLDLGYVKASQAAGLLRKAQLALTPQQAADFPVEFVGAGGPFLGRAQVADFLTGSDTLAKFNKHLLTLKDIGGQATGVMGQFWKEQEDGGKKVRTSGDALDGLARALAQLSQVSGGAFGGFLQGAAQAVTSIDTVSKSVEILRGTTDSLGNVTKASMTAQAAGWASVAGIAVAGTQAILGALQSSANERAARNMGTTLGTQVGEALAEAIRKSIGDIQLDQGTPVSPFDERFSQAGTLLNLGEAIRETGGLEIFGGADKAIAKLGELFDLMDDGVVSVARVGTAFEDVFGQLLPSVLDKATGLVSKPFVALQQAAIERGVQSPALDEFRATQTTQAVGGLGTFLDTGNEAQKKSEEAFNRLIDLNKQLGQTSGQEQDKIRQEIAKTTQEFDTQQKVLGVVQVNTQAAAAAVAGGILASFAELQRGGASIPEALAAVTPAVAGLREQLSRTGLDGGDAFATLDRYVTLAGDTLAGPALTAVGGLGAALAGLSNTGLLTQEMFAGFSGQVTDTFNKLVKEGKNGDDALRLMQPTLQTIFELQDKFGFTVDAGTQALLDQAKAAGIVGDKMKTPQQQQLDATNKIVDALDILNKNFERLVPTAGAAAKGISDELAKIRVPDVSIRARWSVDDLPSVELPEGASRGAFVGPHGLQHLALGGVVQPAQHFVGGGRVLPFIPRGTDTVPAMLTPGEVVLTEGQQRDLRGAFASIVSGFGSLVAIIAGVGTAISEALTHARLPRLSETIGPAVDGAVSRVVETSLGGVDTRVGGVTAVAGVRPTAQPEPATVETRIEQQGQGRILVALAETTARLAQPPLQGALARVPTPIQAPPVAAPTRGAALAGVAPSLPVPRLEVPHLDVPIVWDVPPAPLLTVPVLWDAPLLDPPSVVDVPIRWEVPLAPAVDGPVTAPIVWSAPPIPTIPSVTVPILWDSLPTIPAFDVPIAWDAPALPIPAVDVPVVWRTPPVPSIASVDVPLAWNIPPIPSVPVVPVSVTWEIPPLPPVTAPVVWDLSPIAVAAVEVPIAWNLPSIPLVVPPVDVAVTWDIPLAAVMVPATWDLPPLAVAAVTVPMVWDTPPIPPVTVPGIWDMPPLSVAAVDVPVLWETPPIHLPAIPAVEVPITWAIPPIVTKTFSIPIVDVPITWDVSRLPVLTPPPVTVPVLWGPLPIVEMPVPSLDATTQSFERLVPSARLAADGITAELAKIQTPDLRITARWNVEDFPDFPGSVEGAFTGGFVTPHGIQHFDGGGVVLPFLRRGPDTVPAMLTPGEVVLNAEQQKALRNAFHGQGGTTVLNLESLLAEQRALRADLARDRADLPRTLARAILYRSQVA